VVDNDVTHIRYGRWVYVSWRTSICIDGAYHGRRAVAYEICKIWLVNRWVTGGEISVWVLLLRVVPYAVLDTGITTGYTRRCRPGYWTWGSTCSRRCSKTGGRATWSGRGWGGACACCQCVKWFDLIWL
jgi:hypothetical protein